LHGAASDVGLRALERFLRGLGAMGEPYEALDAAAMATRTGTAHYRSGAHTHGTVTMQPAALVRGIAGTPPENVAIFEDSAVTRVGSGRQFRLTVAGGGEITSDRLFLATNAYTPALGFLRRRIFPLFTFASLTRVLTSDERSTLGGTLEWGLVPEEPMGTTLRRTRDQRILVRNTVHYSPSLRVSARVLGAVRAAHRRALLERFPMLRGVELEYTWGGAMGITLNGAHYFGRLAPNLYAAAGCNGVGVALGTASGTLLADLAVSAGSELLRDILALPGPSWIPPEPFLGVGLRPALGLMRRRARGEL
jgi:glycine/D-amino acid oxidase-like deaminating enzyme